MQQTCSVKVIIYRAQNRVSEFLHDSFPELTLQMKVRLGNSVVASSLLSPGSAIQRAS